MLVIFCCSWCQACDDHDAKHVIMLIAVIYRQSSSLWMYHIARCLSKYRSSKEIWKGPFIRTFGKWSGILHMEIWCVCTNVWRSNNCGKHIIRRASMHVHQKYKARVRSSVFLVCLLGSHCAWIFFPLLLFQDEGAGGEGTACSRIPLFFVSHCARTLIVTTQTIE